MADEETPEEGGAQDEKKKGGSPIVLIAAIAVLALVGIGGFLMLGQEEGPVVEEAKPLVEYLVKQKMYQLKDGSYLKLGFAIVVEVDKLDPVANIIEKEAPGRLPNGINMIVGNKSREDLINGTHKREAFARELKKMLEERVFDSYNKKQRSTKDSIEIKEILISDFVTQSG